MDCLALDGIPAGGHDETRCGDGMTSRRWRQLRRAVEAYWHVTHVGGPGIRLRDRLF